MPIYSSRPRGPAGGDLSGSYPNPDVISLTGSATGSFSADYIDFNTSASVDPTYLAGRLHYGSASLSGDLEYDLPGQQLTLRIGQQTILKIHNDFGATLSKGRLVRFIAGNNSAVPFATTASWVNEDQSAHTIGMVMADIATGQDGHIILEGVLEGVNTALYAAGDLLFLSSSGLFSSTPPPAGTSYHGVRVGQVIRSGNSNTGVVFVKVDNGYEINELHDTDIVNAVNGDLFVRSGSVNGTAQWINTKSLTGSYGILGSLSSSDGFTGSLQGTAGTASYAPNYVPYTGATSNINLGTYGLTASFVSGTTLSASTGIAIDGITLLSSSANGGQISASHGIAAPFFRSSGYLTVNGNTTLGDNTSLDIVTISGSLKVTNTISSSASITGSAFSGSGAGLTGIPTGSLIDYSGISGSVLASDGIKWTNAVIPVKSLVEGTGIDIVESPVGTFTITNTNTGGGLSGAKASVNFDPTPLVGAMEQTGFVMTISLTDNGMAVGDHFWLKDNTGTIDEYLQVAAILSTTTFTANSTVSRGTGIIACTRTIWVRSEYNIASVQALVSPGSQSGWFNQVYRIYFTNDLGTSRYYPMCSSNLAATYNGLWAASIGPAYFYTPAPINSGAIWIGSPNTYPYKNVSLIIY